MLFSVRNAFRCIVTSGKFNVLQKRTLQMRVTNFPAHEELRIPTAYGNLAAKRYARDPSASGTPKYKILALHGWQDNANSFDAFASVILNANKNVELVALDFSGHGLSSHLPPGALYTHWQYLQDIHTTLDYLKYTTGGESKILLVGHSSGGGLALFYSLLNPNSNDGFVSIDPSFVFGQKTFKFLDQTQCLGDILKYNKAFFNPRVSPSYTKEDILERNKQTANWMFPLTPDGACSPEGFMHILRREATTTDDGKIVLARDHRIKSAYPDFGMLYALPQLLDRYTKPVVILKQKLGLIFFEDFYRIMRSEWPKVNKDFSYFDIEGAHHVHLDDPYECVEKVLHFMDTKFTK